jgi:hypothetical protein
VLECIRVLFVCAAATINAAVTATVFSTVTVTEIRYIHAWVSSINIKLFPSFCSINIGQTIRSIDVILIKYRKRGHVRC